MAAGKIPTGLKILDNALNEGFLENSIVTLTSESSTSKDLLVRQTVHSLLKKGYSVVYVCMLHTPSTVLKNLQELYGDEIKEFAENHQLIFVNLLGGEQDQAYDSLVGDFFGDPMQKKETLTFNMQSSKSLLDLSLVLKKALSATLKPDNTVVVMESVADALLGVDFDTALKFERKLETDLKAKGVKLIFYILLKGIKDELVVPFEQHSDYVLELRTLETKNGLKDFLRVKKSQGTIDTLWHEVELKDGVLTLSGTQNGKLSSSLGL